MKKAGMWIMVLMLGLALVAFTGCGDDDDSNTGDNTGDNNQTGDNNDNGGSTVEKPDYDCTGVDLESPEVMDCQWAVCSELATWDEIDETRQKCLVDSFLPCMEDCVDTGDSPREGELFALDCVMSDDFQTCMLGDIDF